MFFDRCQKGDNQLYTKCSGQTEWPISPIKELVLDWLLNLTERFVSGTDSFDPITSQQIYEVPNIYINGSTIKQKMNIGIMGRHGNKVNKVDEKTNSKSNWA